jgi:small subunit ribosomal protein S33
MQIPVNFHEHLFFFLARPTHSKSMKVVRLLQVEPFHKRDYIINWYPRHVENNLLTKKLREYGLYRDEHADFNDEMKRLRYLRGKIPPKKGEGKRAKNK